MFVVDACQISFRALENVFFIFFAQREEGKKGVNVIFFFVKSWALLFFVLKETFPGGK